MIHVISGKRIRKTKNSILKNFLILLKKKWIRKKFKFFFFLKK
jgi:hypothetical protein